MTVFYAYIHNILDDNTWRILLVFSSREVADEWWRAISTSEHAPYFQRINSQFYTHNANERNVYAFFYDDRFKAINAQFRGKLFLTLMSDRAGRDLPIIPVQDYTDNISGNWFYIRSKSSPNTYWYLVDGRLVASDTGRTQFRIEGKDLKDGTIMIGSDTVTLDVGPRRAINVDGSGSLVESGVAYSFKFDDLLKGRIWIDVDGTLSYDNTQNRGQQQTWQLV